MSAVDYKYLGDLDADREEVAWKMSLFHQVRSRRVNFESQWEEASALAWPDYQGSFSFGRDQSPGTKRTQYQLDSTPSILVQRFSSIVDWLITPSNMQWSKVTVTDKNLKKDPKVKEWCAEVSDVLWGQRYKAQANFMAENSTNMRSLAVFGNMAMYIDEIDDWLEPGDRGLRYLGLPIGEPYIILDHQRRVVGCIRHFRLNAQQAVDKWKENARLVPQIKSALEIGSQTLFDFLHFILPNTNYNPYMRLSKAHQKYESTYVSLQGYCILEKSGFRTLPLAYSGYMRAPDEDYWRGPTQMALPTLKSKNAIKRVYLKQGHRAGDPAYLVGDTGLIDLKSHPGAWNSGGMTKDGKPLVGILPTGEIQFTEKMMEMDDNMLNAAYLVDLFKLILENPGEMNARQVVEYVNERGIILFPTVGGVSSGYLGPLTDRELDVLSWNKLLPPMPQALREAKGQYEMEYTNPISLAMRGQKSAAFMRLVETYGGAIQAGASPEIIDILDFDSFGTDEAEAANFGEWIKSPKALAAVRKGRQQAQERETQTKELPGRAAIMKAQAITAKAQTGGNTGGTLSGTPQGGMPLMPGQGQ